MFLLSASFIVFGLMVTAANIPSTLPYSPVLFNASTYRVVWSTAFKIAVLFTSTAAYVPSAFCMNKSTAPAPVGYSLPMSFVPSPNICGCSASQACKCFSVPALASPGSAPSKVYSVSEIML